MSGGGGGGREKKKFPKKADEQVMAQAKGGPRMAAVQQAGSRTLALLGLEEPLALIQGRLDVAGDLHACGHMGCIGERDGKGEMRGAKRRGAHSVEERSPK